MHDLSLQILEIFYGLAYHLLYNIPCAHMKRAFLHWSTDSYIHVIWASGVYGTVKSLLSWPSLFNSSLDYEESSIKIWQ